MAARVRRISAKSNSARATKELQRWRELKDAEIRRNLDAPEASELVARHHQYALYRFYDATGTLLYVGITAELLRRVKQHEGTKAWWHQVANIAVEHFASRADVLEAEKLAIATECPAFNYHHNRRRRSWH
jgi:hypothetical protein